MDKFVKITKPVTIGRVESEKQKHSLRFSPYASRNTQVARQDKETRDIKKEDSLAPLKPELAPFSPSSSTAAVRKHLLKTLKDPKNPIAHSTITLRADFVHSCSTGHQRGEGLSGHGSYLKARSEKIEEQASELIKSVQAPLKGCRVYCDSGFCVDTTAIELKRLVRESGGTVSLTASGATHILTSQHLSGSKTQKLLTTKSRVHSFVVKPEWLFDSIAAGKKKREWDYNMITNKAQGNLDGFVKAA